MEARHAQRLESAVDLIAPAVLAAAAGYATLRLGISPLGAAAAAGATFVAGWKCLGAVGAGSPTFALVEFEPAPLPEIVELDELLLTDADRLTEPATPAPDDALVLDDVLASLGSESRVVRLFDPAVMPTSGQLQARINRHLEESEPPLLSPDASQALHDALAELRRTLR